MGLICSEEMTWEGLCSCRRNAMIKFRAFPVRQCPHTGFQTFPTDGPLAELPKDGRVAIPARVWLEWGSSTAGQSESVSAPKA